MVNVMADRSKDLSIIDKDLKIEGTIHAKGKLVIGGEVEGTLVGEKIITVEGSRVLGGAKVQEIVIGGEFEGDITAYRSLRILPTGNLLGNVVYNDLTLEPGGRLNGNARPLESTDEILAIDTKTTAEGDAGEGDTST